MKSVIGEGEDPYIGCLYERVHVWPRQSGRPLHQVDQKNRTLVGPLP